MLLEVAPAAEFESVGSADELLANFQAQAVALTTKTPKDVLVPEPPARSGSKMVRVFAGEAAVLAEALTVGVPPAEWNFSFEAKKHKCESGHRVTSRPPFPPLFPPDVAPRPRM